MVEHFFRWRAPSGKQLLRGAYRLWRCVAQRTNSQHPLLHFTPTARDDSHHLSRLDRVSDRIARSGAGNFSRPMVFSGARNGAVAHVRRCRPSRDRHDRRKGRCHSRPPGGAPEFSLVTTSSRIDAGRLRSSPIGHSRVSTGRLEISIRPLTVPRGATTTSGSFQIMGKRKPVPLPWNIPKE